MYEEEEEMEVNVNAPGETMYPPRLRIYRYISILFGILAAYLLYKQHFYLSPLCYAISLAIIGVQLKWDIDYINLVNTVRIWVSYVFTLAMSILSIWRDFFAGSIYLFFGFILILIISQKEGVNWINIIFALINIAFSLIFFVLHLHYTVGINFEF